MNDPHVVALNYRIEHGCSVDYSKAEPLVCNELEDFRIEINCTQNVRFELKNPCATEKEAKKCVDEYIRIWEADACLKGGPDYFTLKYCGPEIEDRNPTPNTINLSGRGDLGEIRGSGTLTLKPSKYPSPPSGMDINADIETMYQRYMGYLRGHEPLASMAYFCLTVLENWEKKKTNEQKKKTSEKRLNIEKKFQIPVHITNRIGELSSTKGGTEARKKNDAAVGKSEENLDFTNREKLFLEESVKMMICYAAKAIYCSKNNVDN